MMMSSRCLLRDYRVASNITRVALYVPVKASVTKKAYATLVDLTKVEIKLNVSVLPIFAQDPFAEIIQGTRRGRACGNAVVTAVAVGCPGLYRPNVFCEDT